MAGPYDASAHPLRIGRVEFGSPADLEPPRGKTSVGRRHAIQYREQIQERLRASRRCSDCVHLACGWSGSIGRGDRVFTCLKSHFDCDWAGNEDELRPLLRTAASCDDYEEVDE